MQSHTYISCTLPYYKNGLFSRGALSFSSVFSLLLLPLCLTCFLFFCPSLSSPTQVSTQSTVCRLSPSWTTKPKTFWPASPWPHVRMKTETRTLMSFKVAFVGSYVTQRSVTDAYSKLLWFIQVVHFHNQRILVRRLRWQSKLGTILRSQILPQS